MTNDDLLDVVSLLSFIIGVANYNENLTQSDKSDLLSSLERQSREIIDRIEQSLNYQNEMLEEILEILKGEEVTRAGKEG